MKLFKYLLAPIVTIGLSSGAIAAEEKRSYLLATASTGGTYYPVGVAISTLAKIKLEPKHKISMSAITSAGSGDNVKLLRDNEVQFAILQGLYGAWAWNGEGRMAKQGQQRHFRSVSMLWQNVEHFVVNNKVVKGDELSAISQMKGEKFSIGKKNSGTEGSGRHILGAMGIDVDGFSTVHMGYGSSAGAMQDVRIKGMNIPAGVPVSAITRAFSSLGDDIKVLDVSDESLTKINKDFPLWTRFTIDAGTYPGQDTAINTIAQPNFLAVNADVATADVYKITKTIYENLPFLNSIHKATKAMSAQKAIAGLTVPLHPGAIKYYQEIGLTIPKHLM